MMTKVEGLREELRRLALPAFVVWVGIVLIVVLGAAVLVSLARCLARRSGAAALKVTRLAAARLGL